MLDLSIDFETRSTVDLKKTGAYPYASHPNTDIWVMAYSFGDEEPDIWLPGEPLPARIVEHIKAGGSIRAWNAQFERLIWRGIMVPRYGAPPVANGQWYCTMAEAAAMGIPLSLDKAGKVLGLKYKKDDEGSRLMMQMARPRKVTAARPEQECPRCEGTCTLPGMDVLYSDAPVGLLDAAEIPCPKCEGTGVVPAVPEQIIWWNEPAKLARLYLYCKQDVRVERGAVRALRRLTKKERMVYLLDQRMNDTGLGVDLELIRAAKEIVREGKARADEALNRLTDGAVTEVTQNGRLVEWLRNQDMDAYSVSKPKIAEMLEGELTPDVRAVLELRSEMGRSSVAKLASMEHYADAAGIIRGLVQYHAAHTGRWGGRGPQPQNFPRGEVKDVEGLISTVLTEDYDLLDLLAPPIPTISSMLRAMLIGHEGTDLISGDFSAIEARVLNWLAGEEEILELFRAMDAGDPLKHPYKIAAVRMGLAPSAAEVKKPSDEYQAGKAAELGFGFGMGWEKGIDAAWAVYQLRWTEEMAKKAQEVYRNTHPNVVDFWKETEDACKLAIQNPGAIQTFGAHNNLKAVVIGKYLLIALPGGRILYYAAPKLVMAETPWSVKARKLAKAKYDYEVKQFGYSNTEMPEKLMKLGIEYSGTDQKSKQWGRLRTYGGHLVENIVQAVARDLMAEAMIRLENAGFPPVLTVHDEIVALTAAGKKRLKEFLDIMAETPEWAVGCPIAVEGWQDKRYKK